MATTAARVHRKIVPDHGTASNAASLPIPLTTVIPRHNTGAVQFGNGKSKINKNILLALVALLLSVVPAAAQNCNPLPNQLTNGTTADANQVMANFNSLLNCVNNLQNNLQGYLGGLTLSNDPASPNTIIDTTAGVAMSDDASTLMKTIAFTKNANAAWVVGAGNGCLDTGTALSASTWYHIFLIERTDTGGVDFLCSTSATNPVFPANYSKKRRIGSVRADASSHILAFSQNGDEFLWASSVADANSTSFGPTPSLLTLTVPKGIKVNALYRFAAQSGTDLLISSPDEANSTANSPPGNLTADNIITSGSGGNVRTNTNSQVNLAIIPTGNLVQLVTYGWIDTRGRFN